VFGEALFDHFPDGSRVLGGAPFNVAWHLRGFKADPLLLTAVGEDREGEEILARMGSWRLDTSGVQIHPTRPTGRVTARLVDDQPRFDIEGRQAYDGISIQALPPFSSLGGVSILYHGTLCLREATSAQTLEFLQAHLNLPRLVDVNLRDPWWTQEGVRKLIRGADWLKVNETELGLLSGKPVGSVTQIEEAAGAFQREMEVDAVFVTLGADGAMVVADQDLARAEGMPVPDLVDTVGAGDAFSAVLALGIHAEWHISTTLQRASEFAAAVCRWRGATSSNQGLYMQTLRRWNDAT
jgi:fructokinase